MSVCTYNMHALHEYEGWMKDRSTDFRGQRAAGSARFPCFLSHLSVSSTPAGNGHALSRTHRQDPRDQRTTVVLGGLPAPQLRDAVLRARPHPGLLTPQRPGA
eukprot:52427-Eustigmatos_ZCMA.PRE.1